jgi:UMP-CMP kinase
MAGRGKRFTEEEIASWPHIIFILGGPGSGKGTQCSKLCAEFKSAKHLSAGDLLRAERKKGTSQGEMIERYIKEGKIIPVEVTAKLLKDAIDKDKNRYDVFLIDGFPRDIKNHRGWEKMCGQGGYHVELMLMFECSEEIMTKRLLQRGKTSGRSDDNIASIRKRLRTYIKDTIPVVKSFEKQKKLVRIESNRPVNQVYAEVRRVFEPIMDRKLLGRRLFGGRLPSIRTLIKSSLTYNLVIRALRFVFASRPTSAIPRRHIFEHVLHVCECFDQRHAKD